MRDIFGLTPDDNGFVRIRAERHPFRFVAKGRGEDLDEFIVVVTGEPEHPPSFLGLSIDDASRHRLRRATVSRW